MYNMSTQQIPLCTMVMDENEISKYGLSIDRSVKDIISYLVGAVCWDVSITSNNTLDVKMNTYVLFDKIGRCFNQEHENFIPNPQYLEEEKWRESVLDDPNILISELKNVGDYIDIYMFGYDSWKVQITKMEDRYKYDFFK